MANQTFSDADLEAVMADSAVTVLSGWTEPNTDEPCDETAYRDRLSANHAGYAAKINEAIESVAQFHTTAR